MNYVILFKGEPIHAQYYDVKKAKEEQLSMEGTDCQLVPVKEYLKAKH